MTPRIHVDRPLAGAETFVLPTGPSRHVQVLRLQPGAVLTLFNGAGGEWRARVAAMARTGVTVEVIEAIDADREASRHVTIAVGVPANERMDGLVEKATELGAVAIQPLLCERSVLRLSDERASRRVAHWQAIAVAASEQCGRTRIPAVAMVRRLDDWLAESARARSGDTRHYMLDPEAAEPWHTTLAGPTGAKLVVLSGPEGGFTPGEAAAARASGFNAVTLGARILRADTAPLAFLALVNL